MESQFREPNDCIEFPFMPEPSIVCQVKRVLRLDILLADEGQNKHILRRAPAPSRAVRDANEQPLTERAAIASLGNCSNNLKNGMSKQLLED